ncbi:MAG: hypothetical protein NVS4B6_13860 [Mycobacterium sp.]
MINNAGIHDPGLFADLSVDQFRTMLDVHFFGTLFVARAAWPHFVRAGYGRVVNTISQAMLEVMSMTKETMDEINASMPPDLCAPAAVFLAHESCPLNGEVLRTGMGSVARIAVVFSPGMWRSPITVEDIAENIDTIMNLGDAGVTDAAAPRM